MEYSQQLDIITKFQYLNSFLCYLTTMFQLQRLYRAGLDGEFVMNVEYVRMCKNVNVLL
jgi:hypothetical protein